MRRRKQWRRWPLNNDDHNHIVVEMIWFNLRCTPPRRRRPWGRRFASWPTWTSPSMEGSDLGGVIVIIIIVLIFIIVVIIIMIMDQSFNGRVRPRWGIGVISMTFQYILHVLICQIIFCTEENNQHNIAMEIEGRKASNANTHSFCAIVVQFHFFKL